MKTAYVRAMLPRLARKAGIERRVHAHAFRHSFAFELVNERTPLRDWKEALRLRANPDLIKAFFAGAQLNIDA